MTTLAEAYANAGKALLDLAGALHEAATGAALRPQEGLTADEAANYLEDEAAFTAATAKPVGSAAVCPAHGKPYIEGRFGPYCRERGTDPRWTSEKGYCQVTPKSAAAYLRQKAAVG